MHRNARTVGHRNRYRNGRIYDQVTTSVQNDWWQLLGAGICGIEHSLASASDGPCPRGWGPLWSLGAHAEFPHLIFSTLTTACVCSRINALDKCNRERAETAACLDVCLVELIHACHYIRPTAKPKHALYCLTAGGWTTSHRRQR